MSWWDVLAQVGVVGLAAGVVGAAISVLRVRPWGKHWSVGGYP